MPCSGGFQKAINLVRQCQCSRNGVQRHPPSSAPVSSSQTAAHCDFRDWSSRLLMRRRGGMEQANMPQSMFFLLGAIFLD